MDKASTNGYLTREKFLALSTAEIELEGFGKVKFRKIGRSEYEALWPLPPAVSDTWPEVTGDPTTEAGRAERAETRRLRRDAEQAWLRTLPDEEQVRLRSRANDVTYRVIAACCKPPTSFTEDDARGLGDAADLLFLAIMTKSGLYEQPKPTPATPPAAEAEAAAGASQ